MHIFRFLNEGNDILRPSDLKRALESNNGMKDRQWERAKSEIKNQTNDPGLTVIKLYCL